MINYFAAIIAIIALKMPCMTWQPRGKSLYRLVSHLGRRARIAYEAEVRQHLSTLSTLVQHDARIE
jgi:hypothetical protein